MALNDFYAALNSEADATRKREEAEAIANLNSAYTVNPDAEAERLRLQRTTGVPAPLMEDKNVLDGAQRQAYLGGMQISHTPATAKFLATPQNAALAKDDVAWMTGYEKEVSTLGIASEGDKKTASVMRDVIMPTPARAWSQFLKGAGGIEQWIGENMGVEFLSNRGKYLKSEAQAVEEEIAKEHPLPAGSWSEAGASALSSMYLQSPFMALGALAGTVKGATATSLGLMGTNTAGATYGERREQGHSVASSSLSALWDGTVEVGTEVLPTATLFKMMKPAAKRSVGLLLAQGAELYGSEMIGESLATFLQDANAKVMSAPGMSMDEKVNALSDYITSGEALNNWISTLKSTAIQTTLMGGAGAGIGRLAGKAQASEDKHQQLLTALQSAEESRLRNRDPETFGQFAQGVFDQNGIGTVYFQAEKLAEVALANGLTEEQIPAWAAQYGVSPESLQTALLSGGMVEFEAGKVATHFGQDKVLTALQKDMLVNPEQHAIADMEQGQAADISYMQHLDELYQSAQERRIDTDDIDLWAKEILATPGLKGRVTMDSLMPLIARANVLANVTGVPAIEHLNRMLHSATGLQVRRFRDWKQEQTRAKAETHDIGGMAVSELEIAEIEADALEANAKASEKFVIDGNQTNATMSLNAIEGQWYMDIGFDTKAAVSALRAFAKGKDLTEHQQNIIDAWRQKQAELRAQFGDVPFQSERGEQAATPQGSPSAFALYSPATKGIADSYISVVQDRMKNAGFEVESYTTPHFADPQILVVISRISKAGNPVMVTSRLIHGRAMVLDNVQSLLPEGERSGVLRPLYAAEAALAQRYGMLVRSTLEDKNTQRLYKEYFPGYNQYAPETNPNGYEARHEKTGNQEIIGKGAHAANVDGHFDGEELLNYRQVEAHASRRGLAAGERLGSGVFFQSAIGYPSFVEGFPDSVVVDTKLLTDLVNTDAFVEKGLDSIDIPTKSSYLGRVGRLIEDDKIRKIVVTSIPVDMMDVLIRKKLSADVLFHDVSVIRDLLSIDSSNKISLPVDMASRLVNIVARSAAISVKSAIPKSARVGLKSGTASEAIQDDLVPSAFDGAEEIGTSPRPVIADSKNSSAPGASNVGHSEASPKNNNNIIPDSEKITSKYIFFDDDVEIKAMYQRAGLTPVTTDMLTIDGVERPTRNSNGQPIAQTEEGIRNFWRWFGDSKVVDEQGLPLVVNGLYVKRETPPPIEPKGFKTGKNLRARVLKEKPDVDANNPTEMRRAAEIVDPELYYQWTDQSDYSAPGEDAFFLSGLYGLLKPELAVGRRRKNIPWNKRSTNHAEQKREMGLSVINIVTPENQFYDTRYDLWNSDQENILVLGYLLDNEVLYGSDGEPLLVNAEKIGSANTSVIKSATGNSGAFDPQNPSINMQRNTDPLAALQTEGGNIVTLFERADKSSFLHETGHIFLNDLKYVAETYGAQMEQWEATKQWLGVGPDGVITPQMHERFAEAFEVYLKSGEAPTRELRDVFRHFKKWLVSIYEAAKSGRFGHDSTYSQYTDKQGERIEINPELRDLFGRLIATEQEVTAARERSALIAMLDEQVLNGTGYTPEQIAEYRRIVGQADDSAREKRDKHKLKDRQARVLQYRQQAEAEALQIPLYAFMSAARDAGGINRQKLVDQFGSEGIPTTSSLWRKDGEDVNIMVAERGAEFGFESAGDFVQALRSAPPKAQWIEKRVAQLEAEHDMQQDTQEAIRTASLRRMLELESEWLAKQAGKTATSRVAMRAWAEKTVASRTMKQNGNINKLLAESRKHRQQAIAQARTGKFEEALKSNEQARLVEELIAASYRSQKAYQKMTARWRTIAKATQTKSGTPAKVGEKFRQQINRLLSQYGLAKREVDAAARDLHSFVEAMADDMEVGTILPEWIGVEVQPVDTLNWQKLQELDSALKFLYEHGREAVEGERTSKGIYVAQLAKEIRNRQEGMTNLPELKSDATRIGKIVQGVQRKYRRFFAHTGILRFIAKRMDGLHPGMGPAEQLVQDVIEAMGKANDRWAALSKEIEPQLEVLTKDGKKVYGDIPMPDSLRRQGMSWTKERVVVACLNMGNAGNLQRLMDGYGLTQEDIDLIASKLTAAEWQAIQNIWNAVDSLWPDIAATHEKLNYFRPQKTERQPLVVQTADGQTVNLSGGYYPAKYDKRLDRDIAQWTERDDILDTQSMILQVPTAKAGATKARAANVVRPINLSLSVLGEHVGEMIRYIYLSEPVRDADRVFANKNLASRNVETMGDDLQDMIRPALKNVIRPEPKQYGAFESMRVKTSLYYMAWNFWTAAQNITGVFPSILQADGHYASGLLHTLTNPLRAHRAMLEASSYMRLRESNIERDMRKQIRDFGKAGVEIGGKHYNWQDVQGVGFAAIRFIDAMVSMPAWWGVYNAQMEEHGDVQRATQAADAAVNKALGSGLAIDSTQFQRAPFLSLLAPFMSFAATQQEVLATEWRAMKEGRISKGDYMYAALMTWVAPAVASTFLQGVLMYGVMGAVGAGDDDDREKSARDYLTDIISYRVMGIPFVRDAVNAIVQGIEGKAPVTAARMPITEGYGQLLQFAYRLGNVHDEASGKALAWKFAELVSFFSGIPATRIYDRWQKGAQQIERNDGPMTNVLVPQEVKKK